MSNWSVRRAADAFTRKATQSEATPDWESYDAAWLALAQRLINERVAEAARSGMEKAIQEAVHTALRDARRALIAGSHLRVLDAAGDVLAESKFDKTLTAEADIRRHGQAATVIIELPQGSPISTDAADVFPEGELHMERGGRVTVELGFGDDDEDVPVDLDVPTPEVTITLEAL